MAKIFYYRGKTLDELQKLPISELTKLLPARARRSLKRGFTEEQKKVMKKIELAKSNKSKKAIKTHCRDLIILPNMVGTLLLVHKGKEFAPVNITEDMIGHLLGEFTYNRSSVKHSAPGIGATRSSAAVSVK